MISREQAGWVQAEMALLLAMEADPKLPEAHRKTARRKLARLEAWGEADRVFPFRPDDLSRKHYKVLEALRKDGWEAPDFDLHGLRDCFASIMIARGVELKELQRLMGHESATTTERYYTKHSRDAAARTRKKVEGG